MTPQTQNPEPADQVQAEPQEAVAPKVQVQSEKKRKILKE